MRAPFNQTCTFYDGPGTPTPGFPRIIGVPCRLVSDALFIDVGPPDNTGVSYFTCDAFEPNGPERTNIGGGHWIYNYALADAIEFSELPTVMWTVLRVESCTGPDQASYWRVTVSLDETTLWTACQHFYSTVYRLFDSVGIPARDVSRTGPTTWFDGVWTVTCEVDGPSPDCTTKWRATNGTVVYENPAYNGNGNVQMFDAIGTLPPIFIQNA